MSERKGPHLVCVDHSSGSEGEWPEPPLWCDQNDLCIDDSGISQNMHILQDLQIWSPKRGNFNVCQLYSDFLFLKKKE